MIKEILNFDNFRTATEVKDKLEKIAEELFYNSNLTTEKNKYVVTQLELFISQRTNSELSTPKCNKHPFQTTSGKFYAHKTLKNNRLKSPKNIGLDISCGKEFERYGSILLRGIKNVTTGEEILGPSNVLNELVGNPNPLNQKFSDDIHLKILSIDGLDILDNDLLKFERIKDHTALFTDVQIDNNTATSRYSEEYIASGKEIKKAA
jgi:hypothetical protein